MSTISKFGLRYDREFKEKAVALVLAGHSQGEVSRRAGHARGRDSRAARHPKKSLGHLLGRTERSEIAKGCHCRAGLRSELTTETLALALALARQPPPPGLLHHSDCGSQYAAADSARLAAASGLTLSMIGAGNPYDKALTECFANSLPPTPAAAELMAFDYLETFYNPHRRHSSLGDRSPLAFEKEMFPQNKKQTR